MTPEEMAARIAELEDEVEHLRNKNKRERKPGLWSVFRDNYRHYFGSDVCEKIGALVRGMCFPKKPTRRSGGPKSAKIYDTHRAMFLYEMNDEQYQRFLQIGKEILDILYQNRWEESE